MKCSICGTIYQEPKSQDSLENTPTGEWNKLLSHIDEGHADAQPLAHMEAHKEDGERDGE